jgi:hypothetical protein
MKLKFLLMIGTVISATLILACNDDEIPTFNEVIDSSDQETKCIGTRSSYYGFKQFPEPEAIGKVFTNMASKIDNGVPSSVWIVGGIHAESCRLEFPAPSGMSYKNISFETEDKHEQYLTEFDRIGAKVFLQVEAGMADMKDLIKIVLDRYSHHPSVVGFGADIEWYPSDGITNGNNGDKDKKLESSELQEWDDLVKSYNPSYRIFVKHWIAEFCGEVPVSDVIYINDSQGVSQMSFLVSEFKKWAEYFEPNESGFQIGYPTDLDWWEGLSDPLVDINDALEDAIPDQIFHLFWVDFTIERESMAEYWK